MVLPAYRFLWYRDGDGSAAAADGMEVADGVGSYGMLCGDAFGTGLPTGRSGATAVVSWMVPQPFASIIGNDDGK